MTSEFHADLRATTRAALATIDNTDPPRRDWRAATNTLGLDGLLVAEERGGLGLGDAEMALVAEEVGRACVQSPLLPTVVVAGTLLGSATGDSADVLAGIVDGTTTLTVAIPDSPSPDWTDAGQTIATDAGEGRWSITGTKVGGLASTPSGDDHVLTLAATPDGPALFLVDSEAVSSRTADALDPTRLVVDVEFTDSPGRRVDGVSPSALGTACRRAQLAVAADQVGIARACLDMTLEHARDRTQFERPIGSFQAVKHQCTDAYLAIEFASATVDAAVEAGADDPTAADRAFLTASRAARLATETCIHVHGGLGFTWEHRAHHYWRRARVGSTLFGSHSTLRTAVLESAIAPAH
ncbi:acyl-CoA dehydrogenase family protein [Gordonia terrae]